MKQDSLKTGWTTLDHMTGGLGRGKLTLVAARPGVGKTSFAMEILRRISADTPRRVVVFSLEMTKENFSQRLLSQMSGVDLSAGGASALREREWRLLQVTAGHIGRMNLFVDDTPALTPNGIFERCQRLASIEGSLDLVVIDYLQLLRANLGEKKPRERELAEISRALKGMAKELNCALLLLCQLDRSAGAPVMRPNLARLRNAGHVESDADTILFLHRDATGDEAGEIECIVGKSRAGAHGMVKLSCEMRDVGLVFGDERTSVSC